MDCSTPGFSWSLLKLKSIESVMSSNHLILFQPLLLLPSVFPSISCCLLFNDSAVSDTFATPWTVAHQTPLLLDFPGKNTGMGFHFLLQGIFLTQGSNLCLLYCRQILYPWATREAEHQSLFWWVSSLHQVTKVLELQLQQQSFQWIFRVGFLKDWLIWSSPRDSSRVFSSTTVWIYQFFRAQPSLGSSSHIHTWLLEKR